MSSDLPAPPGPSGLSPLLLSWESERSFVRCHDVRFGATEFNPGHGRGRFHPFVDGSGNVVPTLYAADRLEGALSETIFHDIPVRGEGKRLRRVRFDPFLVSSLACERELTLVQLHGYGLSRIGVSRAELIETEADGYAGTVAWARALHAADARIDGLLWVSRQHDESHALVLFGDRVQRSDLRVVKSPLPLGFGEGLSAVEHAAEQAGILLHD